MSRALNASTGARRRSATGMKTPAAISSPIASHIWLASMYARWTEIRTSRAENAATTQSMAIQWPVCIRWVSGAWGGRCRRAGGTADGPPGG